MYRPLQGRGSIPCFTSYIPDPVIGKHFAQARFYDPAHGRMLAPDPVKRGLNGYPYCGNDPVNYVDPTGEVANILAGGILGGIMGGTFGFAGSAISQIVGGKEFDVREALGAGANGMVVGAVRGALIGSGAGLPVALVSDFTAGTVGSTLEQLITGGKANAGKSIAGGLTNAVSGAIYGNNPLGSLKEAFIKGAKAGAATSGINYLSEVFGGQDEERRSGILRGSLGLVPFGRVNDPRHGCMARDPFGGMTEGGSDYGYQYQIPRRERTVRKAPERFSLAEFAKEMVTGFVMGGLSSAAFYGAGRAVEAVKSSVRSGCEGGFQQTELVPYYPSNDGAVAGTTHNMHLMTGDKIDRYGSLGGKYFSPSGTPLDMRALPYDADLLQYRQFVVVKPFEVRVSTIAPAFGKIGLGTQYHSSVSAAVLLKRGIIKNMGGI